MTLTKLKNLKEFYDVVENNNKVVVYWYTTFCPDCIVMKPMNIKKNIVSACRFRCIGLRVKCCQISKIGTIMNDQETGLIKISHANKAPINR